MTDKPDLDAIEEQANSQAQQDVGCDMPRTALDVILAAGEWLDRAGTFHVGELT